jgi:hypothetical protein
LVQKKKIKGFLMRKGRSTLVLLATIFLLVAFILIQDAWRGKSIRRQIQHLRLFDIDPETVDSFSFQSSNLTVRCQKKNGVWMTGSPKKGMGRADVETISRTLFALRTVGKGTIITPEHLRMRGIDARAYGFDTPSLRISVVDNSGKREWLIGRQAPLDEMCYAKMAKQPEIYTISSTLLAQATPTDSDYFRNRLLFPGTPTAIRRIELRGSDGFIQILKDPKLGWQIQQPLAGSADPQAVENFIKKAFSFRIESFVADEVSDFSVYGLQGDNRQISMSGIDGSSRMVVIGDPLPERPGLLYARHADDASVFALSTNILQILDVSIDTLRDVRLLQIPSSEISYISITRDQQQLEIKRTTNGVWKMLRPVAWNADPKAIEKFLKLWNIAVITEFNPMAPHLDPEWTILFGSTSSGTTNRLEFLPSLGKKTGLLMLRDDERMIYRINLPQIPETILDPLQYKEKQIWNFDLPAIQKISIEEDGKPDRILERTEEGGFLLKYAKKTTPLPPSSQELLKQMASLSTTEYVTYNPRDLSVYGLDHPSLKVRVVLTDSSQLGRVLWVGQKTDHGYYAMLKGRDVVFLLNEKLIDLLSSDRLTEPESPLSSEL